MTQAGDSADHFVEVYDEPDHETCLVNQYVHAYRVRLRPACSTLWHRHSRDTVYFSLSHARAGEQFPAAEAVVTDIPCGAAVSRPHSSEPLIHKVTNRGEEQFFLIGAEAHQRPASPSGAQLNSDDHEQVFLSERFCVYRIAINTARRVVYPDCGLLVARSAARGGVSADNKVRELQSGDLAWVDNGESVQFPAGFTGFFAAWC